MNSSELKVVESIHEMAEGKTIAQRIDLFRAHARTTARRAIAKHLFECADELESAENKCRQLALDFKRRVEG